MTDLWNERAERDMLGCICHSSDLLDTLPIIRDHFFHFAHGIVFDAILQVFRAGGKPSFHSVISIISSDNLRKIGGDQALMEMLRSVPKSAGPDIFGNLDDLLTLRRLSDLSIWLSDARKTSRDGAGVSGVLTELQNRVAGLEARSHAENLLRPVVEAIHGKIDRMDSGNVVSGFRTSIPAWEAAFGGIMDGTFYALAGRPGRGGKTALMEQLIADYMALEIPVLVFEKDMSPQKLIERIACRESGIPYWKFYRQKTSRDENTKIREMTSEFLRANVLRLYSPVGMTADDMCSIARREIRQGGVKCAFLDHVQALTVGRDPRVGLTQASLTLRRHVTETNVPLIALAHLNREAGEGRPTANHIKEFDQLYGDVDGMALLWYEASEEDEPVKTMKFTVVKNRDGAEGEDTMIFDGPMIRFRGKE